MNKYWDEYCAAPLYGFEVLVNMPHISTCNKEIAILQDKMRDLEQMAHPEEAVDLQSAFPCKARWILEAAGLSLSCMRQKDCPAKETLRDLTF